MINNSKWLLLIICTCLIVSNHLIGEESDLSELFAAGKYKEGKELAVKMLENDPNNNALLYNGGLAAYLSDDFSTAITLWKRLKVSESENPLLRAKIIQAYQANGSAAECTKEIAELYALHKEKPELFEGKAFFIRDQFLIEKRRIMALEYFAMSGERAIKYKFVFLDDKGNIERHYSLGSYDTTNEFMQAQKALPNKARYYHLDSYSNGGSSHRTIQFYSGLPNYADVKKAMLDTEKGDLDPISGTDTAP